MFPAAPLKRPHGLIEQIPLIERAPLTEMIEHKATMNNPRLNKALATRALLVMAMALFMAPSTARSAQSIVALVNDEPISAFDLSQRINLVLTNSPRLRKKLNARLKSPTINDEFRKYATRYNPTSREELRKIQQKFVSQIRRDIMKGFRPTARKSAMDELVEERLKLQEAKRLNIVVTKEEVSGALANMVKLNKMTEKQFAAMLKKSGVSMATMRQRLKVSMSWRKAVQRKFGRQMSLTNQYLDRELNTTGGATDAEKSIELQLHRITLPLTGKINQKIMVKRFAEADSLRSRFRSCRAVQSLTVNVKNARYENLGRKRASTFSEPIRTQLLQAKVGQMPPPTLSPAGIQLYAVCGRRKVATDEKKRVAEKRKLQLQEFNILSERHLRDLKQDAYIEYR